jgi:hypothetical protein
VSYAYDFTDPTIDGITFIKENTSISSQLTIYDASLTHKVNPNIISMALQMHKSTDINKKFTELNIPDIDYSNYFKVVGVFETETGSLIFQEITPVGGVYANKTTTIDLYRVDFETNFKLTRGNQIEITSLTDAYGLKGFNVGLKTKMRVITLLHNSIAGVGSSTNVGIDVAYLYPGFTPMTEQEVGITFGRRVDEVFARTDIFYSQAKYQTYVEDVKRIRTKNEYARDIDGNLIYPLEIVYSAGDIDYGGLRFTRTITSDNAYLFIGYKHITGPSSFTVLTATLLTALIGSTILMEEPATTVTVTFTGTNNLDYLDYKVASSGDLIVASGSDAGTVAASTLSGEIELISPRFVHRKGDIVVDGYRNRLIDKERGVNYSLDMIHLDRKLLLSQKVEHEDYLNQYTSLLRSYFEAVSSAKGRLIEETAVYFQPQRSLGVAKFRKNADAAINLDLELSVDLKLYVFQHVMDDSRLKQLIRDAIITIINDALSKGSISVTTIAEIIRTSIPHLVKFVDVKGVNGNIGLQTLIPMDPDVVPGLKQELVISDDGSISMQHALHLEFDPIGVS